MDIIHRPEKGLKLMLMGDAHDNPETNKRRFDWAGQMLVEEQPDVFVQIGDFADMGSVSTHDVGKRGSWNKLYKDDIESVIEAQQRLFKPLNDYNKSREAGHRKKYTPRCVLTLGNHENRINTLTERDGKLFGLVSTNDLAYQRFGWDVIPFLTPEVIGGVAFQHYVIGGVMNKAIGGMHQANAMINRAHMSCTVGHSHTFDHKTQTDLVGRKLHGLVAGCYLDPDEKEDYAGEANKLWWKGLIMKHDLRDGRYDLEKFGMNRIRKLFS